MIIKHGDNIGKRKKRQKVNYPNQSKIGRGFKEEQMKEFEEEEILIPDHYTLTITPAICPEKRHKIEDCLKEMEYKIRGGGMMVDLTSCDISFE